MADAKKAYTSLESFLEKQEDKLYWALKIAATGNIIDSAIYGNVDIENSIKENLNDYVMLYNFLENN